MWSGTIQSQDLVKPCDSPPHLDWNRKILSIWRESSFYETKRGIWEHTQRPLWNTELEKQKSRCPKVHWKRIILRILFQEIPTIIRNWQTTAKYIQTLTPLQPDVFCPSLTSRFPNARFFSGKWTQRGCLHIFSLCQGDLRRTMRKVDLLHAPRAFISLVYVLVI